MQQFNVVQNENVAIRGQLRSSTDAGRVLLKRRGKATRAQTRSETNTGSVPSTATGKVEKKIVLVAGATGRVGRLIVQQLAAKGTGNSHMRFA
jgi:FlaA1/EpsC-like NDP-sugar epimerase